MEANVNRGMTENSAGVHQEMESLRGGFNKLRTDVAEVLSHVLGLGRTSAEFARSQGSDAMETLKQRYDDLRQRGGERMEDVEHKIQENPLTSAMIAFGVGFVIARFMHRRD